MKIILVVIGLFLGVSGFAQPQKVKPIQFAELEKRLNQPNSDTTYLVNFWATWCGPCIKELPDFQEVLVDLKNEKVAFLFVSLDFPNSEERVNQFILNKSLRGEQYLITDSDANEWINKVSKAWQGNIPATVIFNPSTKYNYFHSGIMTKVELKELINKSLER